MASMCIVHSVVREDKVTGKSGDQCVRNILLCVEQEFYFSNY